MVSLGTSSDRIFSPPHRQAYYLTINRTFSPSNFGAYVSFSYSEWEDKVLLPFGISWQIAPVDSILFMNDGRKSHLMWTHSSQNQTVSLLYVDKRYFGVSTSYSF